MLIKFRSMPRRAIEEVTDTFGTDDWILASEESEDPDNELYDVIVQSSFVIVKVLDDSVQLDRGGIKADISEFDFSQVVIV